MDIKLHDSELRVMEVLWRQGDMAARDIAKTLTAEIGWNKNTTYTIIKKCIDKNLVERNDPGFVCSARVTKAQVQRQQVEALAGKLFDGAADKLFAALLSGKKLPRETIANLEAMLAAYEEESG